MGSPHAIVDDALAAYAAYLRAFNARDAAAAAAFYATPTIVASPAGRRVLGARAEVEAMLARSLARLATMDFSATRIVRHAAHAMHDDAVLLEKGIPMGAINNIAQLVEHPQVKARGSLVEMDHPRAGKVRMVGTPFRMSRTPGSVRTPAPKIGEHTDQVMREFMGLSEQRIAELRDRKVLIG